MTVGRRPLVALNFAEFPDGRLPSEITTVGDWSDGATTCDTIHPPAFTAPNLSPCRVAGGILQADPSGAVGLGIVTMRATTPATGRLTIGLGGKDGPNTSTYLGLCDASGLTGAGVVVLAQDDGIKAYDDSGTAIAAWIVPEDASTPYRLAIEWEGNNPTYSVQVNDVEIGTATSEALPTSLTPFVGALTPGDPTVPTATITTASGGIAWATLTDTIDLPAVTAPATPTTSARTGLAIVAATPTGRALTELAPRSGSITFRLGGGTTIDLDVDGHEVGRLEELVSDVVAFIDGRPYTRCRLGPSDDDLTADGGHTVKFTATDRPTMLGRRLLYPHMRLRYVDAPAGDIIAGVLADVTAMPDGDLGVRCPTGHPAGPPVTIEFQTGQTAREAITAVMERIDGAEWDVDVDNLLRWWPTGAGLVRSFVAEWGRNIERLSRSFDPNDYATDLRVSGSNIAVYRTRPRDGGRWDTQTGDPADTVAASAAARADRAATELDGTPAYTATITDWSPSRLWLGDTARLIARSGRLTVDERLRVYEIKVTISPDTNDVSKADVTFGRPRPDLLRGFATDRRRIRDLERR